MSKYDKLELLAWRKEKNIPRKAAAIAANISYSTLSGYESGKYAPDLETLSALLSIYDINIFDISSCALADITVKIRSEQRDLLRIKRVSLNISQEHMAVSCGYKNQSSYNCFETGRSSAKMEKLYRIAEELDVDASFFIRTLLCPSL